jgi:uncharacterized membrane protein YvlD (DUF360 family)
MNTKRLLLTALVVYILLEVLNYLVHGVILASTYQMEEIKEAFRPEAEMNSMMWITYLVDIVWAFFFAFFFAKGYEGRGIMEGLRFGFYIGLFWGLVSAYSYYTAIAIPASLAFQWFISTLIVSLILGVAAALIYKPATATQTEPATT